MSFLEFVLCIWFAPILSTLLEDFSTETLCFDLLTPLSRPDWENLLIPPISWFHVVQLGCSLRRDCTLISYYGKHVLIDLWLWGDWWRGFILVCTMLYYMFIIGLYVLLGKLSYALSLFHLQYLGVSLKMRFRYSAPYESYCHWSGISGHFTPIYHVTWETPCD